MLSSVRFCLVLGGRAGPLRRVMTARRAAGIGQIEHAHRPTVGIDHCLVGSIDAGRDSRRPDRSGKPLTAAARPADDSGWRLRIRGNGRWPATIWRNCRDAVREPLQKADARHEVLNGYITLDQRTSEHAATRASVHRRTMNAIALCRWGIGQQCARKLAPASSKRTNAAQSH